jgi:hypothetical protein
MACQAASATTSLIDALKAGPWSLQRTLDLEKISVMALNFTRVGRGTPLILYLGQRRFPSVPVEFEAFGGDWSFSPEGLHLLSISVQPLALYVAQGSVLLIVLVFIVDVVVLLLLLLLLLLNRCALGYWAPRYHQLNLNQLLLPRCVLW